MASKATASKSGSRSSRAAKAPAAPSAPASGQPPHVSSSLPSDQPPRANDFEALGKITDLLSGDAPEDSTEPRSESSEGHADDLGPDIPEEGEGAPETREDHEPEYEADGDPGADQGDTPGQTAAPGSLAELAQRLDMEPADLYNVELTTGDGDAVTIGQLKDAWQDREAGTRETEARAAALDERETAVAVDQQLMARIVQDLGHTLTPQQRAAIERVSHRRDDQFRAEMLAAMPELKDEHSRTGFEEQAASLLREYNVPPHQVRMDHAGMVVMMRDFMRARDQLEKLKKYRPPQKAAKSARSQGRGANPGKGQRERMIENARGGTTEQQVAGVSALLNGG